MDTGFENCETKNLGLTMLFSVIPKKTLDFSGSAVSIAEALITGTEYDLERFTKNAKLENVFA
jgi:hypothetical protein